MRRLLLFPVLLLSVLVTPRPAAVHVATIYPQVTRAVETVDVSRDFVRTPLPAEPPVQQAVQGPDPKPLPLPHKVPTPPPATPREYAKSVLSPAEFECLDFIVDNESAWVVTKYNYGGSGAYGIPQALPKSKMAVAGSDYLTNGITQVKWMILYVNQRYGSACKAKAHWKLAHSY